MHKDFLNKRVGIQLREPIVPPSTDEPIQHILGRITFSGTQGSFIVVDGTILIPHGMIAAIFIVDDKEAT